ncbi:MAG: hypothetical protein JST04_03745 [Bdellovibrionales bacterium]|nr:hypothetical protein [Bdellovibrionales bacterium]
MPKTSFALVLLASLGFSTGAHAGMSYETLNRLYGLASRPSPARMLGWYTGRCYGAKTPELAEAGLLTTYRKNGVLKAVFWRESGKPVDYYDHPSAEMIRDIEDGLAKYDADIPPLVRKSGYWEAVHLGPHKDATRTRANVKMILVQAFHDDAETMACFFFRRVH